MKKQVKFLAYLALIGLALTGCASSDDPIDDDGPSIPSDAAIIDIDNATAIAIKALDTFDLLGNTLPNAALTETYTCPNGGNYTDSWTTGITGKSGQMNFDNCGFTDTLTLSGIYNYSSTIDLTTSDLTQTGDANNFSLGYNGNLYTLNVEFSVTIDSNNVYSIATDFSLSGIPDQGLLFTTVTPLSGTYPGGVQSGQVVIKGANNTRLRITVTNNGIDAEVELDNGSGTFVSLGTIPLASAGSPTAAPAPVQ